MERTIMISDIHGCMKTFDQMLGLVNYNSKYDQLILLGDYVDRGPESKEVVEKVIDLVQNHQAIAIRGNHDQRLVDLIKNNHSLIKTKFLEHGGMETLKSYCNINHEFSNQSLDQAIETIGALYSYHIKFLSELPLYHEDYNHIYVHAGLNPDFIDWKSQPEHDFMYMKEKFIQHRFHLNKRIVFGHTRTADIHGSPAIWFSEDKIGIDGGCAYGMQLNALIYQGGSYVTKQIRNY